MEDVLNSTQTEGEKVLIFSHIPPGKFERFYQFCGEEKGCDLNGGYHGFHWLSEDFNNRFQYTRPQELSLTNTLSACLGILNWLKSIQQQ